MTLLGQDEIDRALADRLPAWQQHGDTITREVSVATFLAGIGLVQRVAEVAEVMNHHPDIDIRYTTVRFTLSTHSAGGLTIKDLELASHVDELAAHARGNA